MNHVIRTALGVTLFAMFLSGCASAPPSQSTTEVTARKQSAKEMSEAPPAPRPATPTMSPYSYYAMCGGHLKDLKDVLGPITQRMVSQQIPYSQVPSDEWRDCSGNFLRLSSYLAEACPELNGSLAATQGITDYKAGANNVAEPAEAVARTTRDIARWYSENGRFTPIYYDKGFDEKSALEKYRTLIRPGAVLWFSHEKPTSSAGLEPLFGYEINHMGTVVSVARDNSGEVVSYEMYHGRSEGKVATITKDHFWNWPKKYLHNGYTYPPLGYWGQYLVGIGTIAPIANATAFHPQSETPVKQTSLN